MSWGTRSLWERRQRLCVVCSPAPIRGGQLSQHKGCPVRLALQLVGVAWGGGGPREWLLGPEWQWGKGWAGEEVERQVSPAGPRKTLGAWNKLGLLWPPSHVWPAEVRRDLGPAWQVRGWLCTWAVHRQCPEPVPSGSHLDLIILLSISELEGVGLHRAGHGGPAACLGCPHSSSRLSQEDWAWDSIPTGSRRASTSG